VGVFKTLFFSVIIVILLQVRIQDQSIESHILNWARSKQVSQFLNRAAEGTIELAHGIIYQGKSLLESLTQAQSDAAKR